jgi:hypothetical protein
VLWSCPHTLCPRGALEMNDGQRPPIVPRPFTKIV